MRQMALHNTQTEGRLPEMFTLIRRFRLDMSPRWGSISLSEEHMLLTNMQGDVGKLVFSNLDGGSEPAFELVR